MSLQSIVICILGLGILAAFHEVGHFLAAKRLGIKVEELSIFVGPSLIHWKRKGVDYHIRLIPFGAYVRFPGLEDEDGGVSNPDSYFNQPRWKRLIIALAGPFTNLALGVVIFAVVFSNYGFLSTNLDMIYEGTQIAETNAVKGDEIISVNGDRILTQLDLSYALYNVPDSDPISMVLLSDDTGEKYRVTLNPTITSKYRLGISVMSELDANKGLSIAEVDESQNDGNPVLKPGDSLLAINGILVSDPEYANVVSGSNGNELTVTIIRDGVQMDVKLAATIYDTSNARGIYLLPGTGIASILRQSVLYSISIIKVSFFSLRDVATGTIAVGDAVAGPVGIATIVSDVVDAPQVDNSVKLENLGILSGLISVGLVFSNLLPLPGLDGNAMVLVVIEMIRGKKLSLKTEQVINGVGFVVLIALVIFALSSDIMRLVG